jgi:hypothetical protein
MPSGQNWWPNTWREHFPSAWGQGQNTELKQPVQGWRDSEATVGKAKLYAALEKPSKLKLRFSPTEKLISNS